MVNVLFDHNMPPVIPRALDLLVRPFGHQAIPLRDKFPVDIEDIDYFTALGKERDWVVISKDVANAKRKPEREAIIRSGVLTFYLSPKVGKQSITQQAATILWQWDKICDQRARLANGLFLLPEGKGSKFRTL
ncbi:hypothetical protein [Neptunicoccus sediminis]|uniref:PIN-like domain-containing protein n=1 Tax=Neptunicoccus sediminis TaxID=1892596 RepID=UPI0012FFB6DE|nr:hypothetical protein [Neptunicoccus sediminis]